MERGTIIMVVLALAFAGGAWTMRPQPVPAGNFEDTGEPLFPDFRDPTIATSLEVIAWDGEQARVISFKVEQQEGRWVIPSHNSYPADGTKRMGDAAASFIDVKKDRYYGDNPADHAAFGVLDPDGDEGKDDEKGQRITIKDAAGTVLVDIIVGKEIEKRSGYYYVREPGESKRVYGSKLKLDISTKFEDWIEKDLLKVERDEFVSMIYDPYKVDELEGKLLDSEPIPAVTDPGGDGKDWILAEGAVAPDGKVLDSMKVRQILTQVANLKIAGVRPRPPARNVIEQQLAQQDMQRKGFFFQVARGPDGRPQLVRLLGNEGEVKAITEDGLVYTLYFGEVTYESGIALTAGVEPAASEGEDKGVVEEAAEEGEDDKDTNKTASRFLFVDVEYDATLDRTLSGGTSEGEGDEDGGEGDEEPAAAAAASDEDEQKKLKGEQRATKLRQRFDQWFYVISDTSFKQLHTERSDLGKDAPAPDGEAEGA